MTTSTRDAAGTRRPTPARPRGPRHAASRRSRPSRRSRAAQLWADHRGEIITVAVLVAVTIATLVVFRREPVFSDDVTYWERWPQLTRSTSMANPYRLSLVFSAELARWIFGHSMWAYWAVGIGFAVGLIVAVYALTRVLFPRPAAIGAAALLLTGTVFLQDATLLLPDWPSMFFFVSGLALLAYAATRLEHDPRAANWVAVWAGVAVYLSVLTKEGSVPILFTVPLCLLVLTRWRPAVRLTAITAGVTAALAVVELGVMWWLYGDPLRRILVVLTGHVGRRTSERIGGRVENVPDALESSDDNVLTGGEPSRSVDSDGLTWGDLAGRYLDPLQADVSTTIVLGLVVLAVIVTIVSRSRRLWFLLIPTIVGLGWTVFGVGSVNPIVPMLSMKYRYLSLGWVFLLPLIAGAVWTLTAWLFRQHRRPPATPPRGGLVAAVVVFALVIGTPTVYGVVDNLSKPIFVVNGSDGLSQAAGVIDQLRAEGVPIERIVTDPQTRNGLRIQLRGDDMALAAEPDEEIAFEDARPGDLVIVNRKRHGYAAIPSRGNRFNEIELIPPGNWRELTDAVYTDIFIYYVTDDVYPDPPSLRHHGEVVTTLMRAHHLDDEGAEFGWQTGPSGMFTWMVGIDNARTVLGRGSHPDPPEDEEAELLAIRDAGRLGVLAEMHMDPDVELRSAILRIYDADGDGFRDTRMYRIREEERSSTIEFAVDTSDLSPITFGASLQVDPARDSHYRIIMHIRGTGVFTVDRVAHQVIPTVAP